ncbi:uncharacterized protein V1510DRAFT_401126 [Dipodascopsis tothii]|uniref:uncharacterized protein n=1 Tax=Dipodascopsis tothii TaxID=44089 RepID=UPI0034D0215A
MNSSQVSQSFAADSHDGSVSFFRAPTPMVRSLYDRGLRDRSMRSSTCGSFRSSLSSVQPKSSLAHRSLRNHHQPSASQSFRSRLSYLHFRVKRSFQSGLRFRMPGWDRPRRSRRTRLQNLGPISEHLADGQGQPRSPYYSSMPSAHLMAGQAATPVTAVSDLSDRPEMPAYPPPGPPAKKQKAAVQRPSSPVPDKIGSEPPAESVEPAAEMSMIQKFQSTASRASSHILRLAAPVVNDVYPAPSKLEQKTTLRSRALAESQENVRRDGKSSKRSFRIRPKAPISAADKIFLVARDPELATIDEDSEAAETVAALPPVQFEILPVISEDAEDAEADDVKPISLEPVASIVLDLPELELSPGLFDTALAPAQSASVNLLTTPVELVSPASEPMAELLEIMSGSSESLATAAALAESRASQSPGEPVEAVAAAKVVETKWAEPSNRAASAGSVASSEHVEVASGALSPTLSLALSPALSLTRTPSVRSFDALASVRSASPSVKSIDRADSAASGDAMADFFSNLMTGFMSEPSAERMEITLSGVSATAPTPAEPAEAANMLAAETETEVERDLAVEAAPTKVSFGDVTEFAAPKPRTADFTVLAEDSMADSIVDSTTDVHADTTELSIAGDHTEADIEDVSSSNVTVRRNRGRSAEKRKAKRQAKQEAKAAKAKLKQQTMSKSVDPEPTAKAVVAISAVVPESVPAVDPSRNALAILGVNESKDDSENGIYAGTSARMAMKLERSRETEPVFTRDTDREVGRNQQENAAKDDLDLDHREIDRRHHDRKDLLRTQCIEKYVAGTDVDRSVVSTYQDVLVSFAKYSLRDKDADEYKILI